MCDVTQQVGKDLVEAFNRSNDVNLAIEEKRCKTNEIIVDNHLEYMRCQDGVNQEINRMMVTTISNIAEGLGWATKMGISGPIRFKASNQNGLGDAPCLHNCRHVGHE